MTFVDVLSVIILMLVLKIYNCSEKNFFRLILKSFELTISLASNVAMNDD